MIIQLKAVQQKGSALLFSFILLIAYVLFWLVYLPVLFKNLIVGAVSEELG